MTLIILIQITKMMSTSKILSQRKERISDINLSDFSNSSLNNCSSSQVQGTDFVACNLKIFCNNVDGFLSKRHKFLNLDYHLKYDILIFQETNISEDHVKVDDFSLLNLASLQFFRTNPEKKIRGSLIAWNPDKVDIHLISKERESDFEIGIAKVSTGYNYFYLISVYRSPSLSRVETLEFFQTLHDKLLEIEGKIVIFGDLNLEKGRTVHYKSDEFDIIRKFILRLSFKNLVSGNTHFNKIGKTYNQFDYAFSNFSDASAYITCGFPGVGLLGVDFDHAAITIEVNIKFPVVTVPIAVFFKKDQLDQSMLKDAISEMERRIIDADLPIEQALLEMELAQLDFEHLVMTKRVIPSHTRIRGCSRQVSNEILNVSGSFGEIEARISSKIQVDMARRIRNNLITKSFGERVMAIFNLGSKKSTMLKCNIDPEIFRREILVAENSVDHEHHPELGHQTTNFIKPLDSPDKIETAIRKLKSKWFDKSLFPKLFWKHISSRILTSHDRGVRPYTVVEPVIKNKDKLDESSGWRLVWKATSLYEKCYDLLRSMTVQVDMLNNDAYCADRSTQRTLAKVASWDIPPGYGLLGCDFKNASLS